MTDIERIEFKKWSLRKMWIYTVGVILSCSTFVWGVSAVIHSINDNIKDVRTDLNYTKEDVKKNTEDIKAIKRTIKLY